MKRWGLYLLTGLGAHIVGTSSVQDTGQHVYVQVSFVSDAVSASPSEV